MPRRHARLDPPPPPPVSDNAAFFGDMQHLGWQGREQAVLGPIQDDEALLLYAMIRTTQVRRVAEIGGYQGFSAQNFMAALRNKGPNATLYTFDVNAVPQQRAVGSGPRHIPVVKDARDVNASDLHHAPLDLLFLDCHDFSATTALLARLLGQTMLAHDAYVALHDTGLHPIPVFEGSRPIVGNERLWIHQAAERKIADWLIHNDFRGHWQRISFHDDWAATAPLRYRHGLTLMQRRVEFKRPCPRARCAE